MNRNQVLPQVQLSAEPSALKKVDFCAPQSYRGAGFLPISDMPRLAEEASSINPGDGFDWQMETHFEDSPGSESRQILELGLKGRLQLVCQRCLQDCTVDLDEKRRFVLLATEAEADDFPMEDEEQEPLVASQHFNLLETIEDEVLLSLPLIYILITNTAYTDIFMYIIGPLTLILLLVEMRKLDGVQIKQLFAALIFIFLSIVFWAFFEQSGGSLSLVARDLLSNDLGPIQIDPNVVNNSANSLFVILLSTAIGGLWIWLKKRNIEPNYYQKFGFAFLFLGLAFYIFYALRFYLDSEGMASLWLFTLAYLVISIGELFLSPIGLSLMTKLSPKHLWGIMMGMWFLASAYGQYFAGILGAGMASPDEKASLATRLDGYTQGYYQLAIYAFITGAVVILASRWLKRLMHTEEEA